MFKEKVRKLYACRHILWDMALSQLKAKYSGPVLGIFWAVINPLLITLVVAFIFTSVFTVEMKNFSLFVLAGIFPWMFLSSALPEATSSIISQQVIIRQFNLPRVIIPLSVVTSNFLNFLIGWMIIYPIFLFFNPKIILLLPLLIICILLNFIFMLGLGILFSILNVIFRDLSHLLGVLLMLWIWATPVFYSLEMVPQKFSWIFNINPMVPYILYYQDVLFNASVPGARVFLSVFLWASLILILGWVCFSALEERILKRI